MALTVTCLGGSKRSTQQFSDSLGMIGLVQGLANGLMNVQSQQRPQEAAPSSSQFAGCQIFSRMMFIGLQHQ
eukprot:scaffold117120_cov31-Attheya_sp.AAC.1